MKLAVKVEVRQRPQDADSAVRQLEQAFIAKTQSKLFVENIWEVERARPTLLQRRELQQLEKENKCYSIA